MLLILCVLPAGMSRSAWIAAAVSGAWVYGMHISWGSKLKEIRKIYKRKVVLACIAGSIIFNYSYRMRAAVKTGEAQILEGLPKVIWMYDVLRKSRNGYVSNFKNIEAL